MKEYKVVPCPGKIVAKKSSEVQNEMSVYANVIAQETVGGWELVSSSPVVVATSKRRLKGKEIPYIVFVFAREKGLDD